MLKKLFLSIIILSALASEGGAYFSADIIDYYLVNFARLDMMQESVMTRKLPGPDGFSEKKGTPAAFYKLISQNAIDVKNSVRHKYLDFKAIATFTVVLALFAVSFYTVCVKKSFYTRRTLLNLTDSSPPALC